ncbi:acyl carrier protein [Pseudomonas sp. FW215-R2]|jgi:acyl carrier protein|uniref:acyl carrier protein n=1 Tax=Pseudomonas TaxID=286 RepID=UPI000BD349D6|nr:MULTISPECIES: acyl carrier protein [Pseudomonas]PCR95794.1 acyl carrier protein [Pseudomonas fluorescens]PMW96209.1 acyl carrier protein [Pseudomonas sp. FW215-R2]PMX06410.1 acyl carrier protein [Pseudomonas sp. FW215-L1]PMX19581.1 acyl carrier protein [Pseudomonas sp. FW215-E1]PNA25257.1 acyl carrier protein [Pseudomonas sp. FW215-R4]
MPVDSRFVEILRTVAELDATHPIDESQELQALGIDSLKLIDVVMSVEREFGTELDEDALVRARTVGELWREIEGAKA